MKHHLTLIICILITTGLFSMEEAQPEKISADLINKEIFFFHKRLEKSEYTIGPIPPHQTYNPSMTSLSACMVDENRPITRSLTKKNKQQRKLTDYSPEKNIKKSDPRKVKLASDSVISHPNEKKFEWKSSQGGFFCIQCGYILAFEKWEKAKNHACKKRKN